MPAEPTIEKPPAPETEAEPEFLEAKAETEPASAPETAAEQAQPASAAAAPPAPAKDESLVKVEKILEENLKDVFFTMSPPIRVKFKAAGEKLALQLRGFVDRAKASSKMILNLIRKWLAMIPRVNRYFLDQEAKIKTDKIMRMINEKKQEKP
ncbi:hypothetical protein HY633_03650 [Candidatus Uhrbacteria bacterium]|nr:hypothetical protein [Candidatus Uhrbacteria bacterium]